VPERHTRRALVDTSVILDLERVDPGTLPEELAISAVTLAELAAGPHATDDPAERARRQDQLQRVEGTFDVLPLDAAVARTFGRVYAAVAASGRKARGRRALDMMIAATGLASDLPIYTRNADDFRVLAALVDVRPVVLAVDA
jgi:predicted nucleic acid-binding protein